MSWDRSQADVAVLPVTPRAPVPSQAPARATAEVIPADFNTVPNVATKAATKAVVTKATTPAAAGGAWIDTTAPSARALAAPPMSVPAPRDRIAERAERLARLRAGLPKVGAASASTSPASPAPASPASPAPASPAPVSAARPLSSDAAFPSAGKPAAEGKAFETAGPEAAVPGRGLPGRRESPVIPPRDVAPDPGGEVSPGITAGIAPRITPEFTAEFTSEFRAVTAEVQPGFEDAFRAAEAAAWRMLAGLDRLSGMGPGLAWALRRAGVPDLAAVAALDGPALAARLGPIGRLVPAAAWVATARAALEDFATRTGASSLDASRGRRAWDREGAE